MRVLIDEGVPWQVLEPLRRNKDHEFEHVAKSRFQRREDRFLFGDAVSRGFDVIIVLDVHQLLEPTEWRALRASSVHHVSLRQGRTVRGQTGVARVIAPLVVAMPYVLRDLQDADSQRMVEIELLAATARHTAFDPRRERKRYPYWR